LCHHQISFAIESCVTSELAFAAESYVTSELVIVVEFGVTSKSVLLSNPMSLVNQVTSKSVSLSNPVSWANQLRYRILCHQWISFHYWILSHQRISFRCWFSMIDFHVKNDLNTCNDFMVWLCNMYGNELRDYQMQMCWFVIIWCIKWCDWYRTFDRTRTPHRKNR